MSDPGNTVVVIGAGIGGLSAAIHLAVRGWQVKVFEKNPTAGGKMGEWTADGFRWDCGPSVITMRPVLEGIFQAAGRRMEDYLSLLPVDPLTRYFYADGAMLDAYQDLARMQPQIAALNPADVQGYAGFLEYAARMHRITSPVFTFGPPIGLHSLSKVSLADALQVHFWKTLEATIRHYVSSPELRQMLGRFATYVGASPYLASTTLSVIAHVEMNEGVYYPRGGIYQIARSLVRLAEELGVEIHLDAPVAEIAVRAGKTNGVALESGRRVEAQHVIANLDVSGVYERLLPSVPKSQAAYRRLAKRETSSSGFILLLGVEGEHPQLAHHNIFFSSDYPREFRQIFTEGAPPDEPTIYVAITSKTDREHAPDGCENWFVMVNAPPLGEGFDWQTQAQTYRRRVLERLAEFGLDVRQRIRVEKAITPEDLARWSAARRGALYGMSYNHWSAPFLRPHNRSALVEGLYFAGGTTHPGGGVPLVALSGKLVAEMIGEAG